jgi:hypothetical protein
MTGSVSSTACASTEWVKSPQKTPAMGAFQRFFLVIIPSRINKAHTRADS